MPIHELQPLRLGQREIGPRWRLGPIIPPGVDIIIESHHESGDEWVGIFARIVDNDTVMVGFFGDGVYDPERTRSLKGLEINHNKIIRGRMRWIPN